LELPDVPRWIEAHGIANDRAGWREALGGGFAIGHDVARLIVVAGAAEPATIAQLVRGHAGHTLLFGIEREDIVATLDAMGRPSERAILHTLEDPTTLPDLEGAAPLGDAVLDHVPPALADELRWARGRGAVWAAWVAGKPVSFAYAPWRSARWFDVSVDTLADTRQLGLATIVAAAMIRDERASGREPVWGADEGNTASLRLARRLGFTPHDHLWVAAGG
jgi:hypothetical protein